MLDAAPPAPPAIVARSVEGRPIRAVEVGDRGSATRVLVVGCIHGNEGAGIPVARALVARPPAATDLWVVTNLNPDGYAARTRGNARGVDLNRNFPWRWRPGPRGSTYYPGARALSEPESRFAFRLIRRIRPQVTIWFHQHMNLVDLSGGDRSIERRFSRLSGLRLGQLGPRHGSAVDWENAAFPGTTAFVVELPRGRLSRAAVARLANAVRKL